MQNKSTMIIGGGAAGLCAAILLGRAGQKVTLLEQNSDLGKKILVSGNGKCNITNRHISPSRFHGSNPDFIEAVLEGYEFEKVETFFESIGLILTEGKEGKMFPMSFQAASVVELLEYEAKQAGATIVCECKVTRVNKLSDHFLIESTQGTHEAHNLLVTAGSPAAPQLGGNDSGYLFASTLGHTLVPRHPALVQLVSEEKWVKRGAGIKMAGAVTLYANGEEIVHKEGDILFTNYGVSGLAVLDLSREVSIRLAAFGHCELSLDLVPRYNKEQLTNLMLGRIEAQSRKPLMLWLQGMLHKKIAKIIMEQSGVKSKIEGELNRKEINTLVHTLKQLKLTIKDTKGFQHAEVATGGIDTREVDPRTMASKIVSNLYFAGEVVDVDGDRGGFNFHFAWVSAMRAAKAIKKS